MFMIYDKKVYDFGAMMMSLGLVFESVRKVSFRKTSCLCPECVVVSPPDLQMEDLARVHEGFLA